MQSIGLKLEEETKELKMKDYKDNSPNYRMNKELYLLQQLVFKTNKIHI